MPNILMPTAQPTHPYVRYFGIIRDVLEDNIAVLVKRSGKSRKEICQEIKAQVDHCLAEWFSGSVPLINYQNPMCRLAYLYEVVPATANLIEHAFASDEELSLHFNNAYKKRGTVSICAFGGGPGTELLGVCKWIEKTRPQVPIFVEYLLLDRVKEWLDSWMAIKGQVELRFKKYISKERQKWPVVLSGMVSPIDIKDSASLISLGNIFGQDIYVLSYLISEIFANFEPLRNFTEQIADCAPKGAKFLFVDRNGSRWKNEVATVAKQAGIKLSECHVTHTNMSQTEQATDLGSLCTDVGINPKVTWNAFWVIGTKS